MRQTSLSEQMWYGLPTEAAIEPAETVNIHGISSKCRTGNIILQYSCENAHILTTVAIKTSSFRKATCSKSLDLDI